jgi:hypothetical protein
VFGCVSGKILGVRSEFWHPLVKCLPCLVSITDANSNRADRRKSVGRCRGAIRKRSEHRPVDASPSHLFPRLLIYRDFDSLD